MLRLPAHFAAVILCFAPLSFQRSWRHAEVLVTGAILVPGQRTVASILRIGGLCRERRFVNYHRILNRAAWSGRAATPPLPEKRPAFAPLGAAPPLLEPALLDVPEGMAEEPDLGWSPAVLRPRAARSGSLTWIAGGVAVLLAGWLVLGAAGLVVDQFARSTALGRSTATVFTAALLLVCSGVWHELGAYRRLRQVDVLRSLLRQDDGPVGPARTLALGWLDTLTRVPGAAEAREAVAMASDMPLLRAILRKQLSGPLRQATRRAGNRAAMEGGVVVAISPSPALDGVLAGLRVLALVRQVAQLHGMRPGGAVTLALLRRLAWTAAGTSGLDLLGRTLADGALAYVPVLKQIAAAVPGSNLTAFRLRRLAEVTGQACSPLEEG